MRAAHSRRANSRRGAIINGQLVTGCTLAVLLFIAIAPVTVGRVEEAPGQATLAATPVPASTTPIATAEAPATSFQALGYGDVTARSMDSVLSFFFPVQEGRTPDHGSEIDLRFSHSPLLVATRSTMTVVVNGQSVDSVFLTKKNADRGDLRVPLPVAASGDDRIGGYSIEVAFHLRLTEAECEEPQNPALWATVHGDSTVNLRLHPSPGGANLADLAGLFAPAGTTAPPVAVVLSTDPAPEEVEAAGIVAFQLG